MRRILTPWGVGYGGFLLLLILAATSSSSGQTHTVTAKLVKSRLVEVHPAVRLVDQASGVSLYREPGFWGENPYEFYFSLKVPEGKSSGPVVEVDMKGVAVDRVLVPHNEEISFELDDGKIRFRLPNKEGNLLSVTSSLNRKPNINFIHFWNLKHRRAGLYAPPEPWPEKEVLAHITYKFAARKAFRYMKMNEHIADHFSGRGYANISGFETNYPEQHKDFPPHLHLWFQWPDWGGYATHYYISEEARITANSVHNPDGSWTQMAPGEWLPAADSTGQAVFHTRFTEGGDLEVKKRQQSPIYTLRAENPRTVRVIRDGTTLAEVKLLTYRPMKGRMVIRTTDYLNRERIEETIVADPDLGTVRKYDRTSVSI